MQVNEILLEPRRLKDMFVQAFMKPKKKKDNEENQNITTKKKDIVE